MTPQSTEQQIHIPPAMYIISEEERKTHTNTHTNPAISPPPTNPLVRLCCSSSATTRRQMSLAKAHFTRDQARTRPFMKPPGIAQFTVLSVNQHHQSERLWGREGEGEDNLPGGRTFGALMTLYMTGRTGSTLRTISGKVTWSLTPLTTSQRLQRVLKPIRIVT